MDMSIYIHYLKCSDIAAILSDSDVNCGTQLLENPPIGAPGRPASLPKSLPINTDCTVYRRVLPATKYANHFDIRVDGFEEDAEVRCCSGGPEGSYWMAEYRKLAAGERSQINIPLEVCGERFSACGGPQSTVCLISTGALIPLRPLKAHRAFP